MLRRVLASLVFFLAVSAVHAQRLRQFSGPEDYEKEVFDAVVFTQKEKKLFQDSLVPQFMALYEGAALEQWIDVSNVLLRKRLSTAEFWEDFFRLAIRMAEMEDSLSVQQLLSYVKDYSRANPARDIRQLVHRMYLAEVKRVMGDEEAVWLAPYSEWTLIFENGTPFWTISEGDIIGRFRKDSTLIEGTSGKFFPEQGSFEGRGGTVFWTRVGLSAQDVFATLQNWNLDVSNSGFEADSAWLNTNRYIDEPALGKFEDRLSNSGDRSNFPRFQSYRYDYIIPNILENIHYQGGISVIGQNFYGGSIDDQFARLRFTYNGDTIVSVRSNQFRLGSDQLQSNNAQVVAYLGDKDSIYHRSCEMRFVSNTGELRVTRLKTGLGLSSFNNTYHQINMSVDQMVWRQGTAFIDFQNLNLGSQAEAVFESSQYFRVLLMEQIAGLQREHPLVVLSRAASSLPEETMNTRELIQALRMPYEEGLHFLYQMAILGFAEMDEVKELYTLSPRVSEFLANYSGKRDYDVIQFVSRVSEGANARLSLLNFDLEMAGIGQFAVSDSQEVYITPRRGLVNMRENLNFSFDGRINAGLFTFWGTAFTFSYDQFNIDMPSIDSMRFKVKEFDSDRGEYAPLVNVQTALQDLIGQIEIDKPNNKSSRVVFPEYPIFTTTNSSYVYYDKPEIHGGAYLRDRFYMKVNPFSIDSLNNTSTDGISFDATWFSGGIFPTMEQPLTVQRDYSLGFTRKMNAQLAYGGQGTYTGEMVLSNQGLHASGSIDYIKSHSAFNDILFFLDSAKGYAQSFAIEESASGNGYPDVQGRDDRIRWYPYQDLFESTSTGVPFSMYASVGMKTEGKLSYGPKGLIGKGELRYDLAEHSSTAAGFEFYRTSFESSDQDFRVKARPTDEQWTFQMPHSSTTINFDRRDGVFDKIDPTAYIKFPVNRYLSTMDHAFWKMDKGQVDVKSLKSPETRMVSAHPLQDSLEYTAGFARMTFGNALLEVFKVPEIDVADARIFPDTGYVAIRTDAQMDSLVNAKILANRDSKFHQFYDAVVRISSKKRYLGYGKYDYIDAEGSTYVLNFKGIRPNENGESIAVSEVEEQDNFYLSPFFAYRGRVELTAGDANMFYYGSVLIQHQCRNLQSTWFDVQTMVDPKDIVFEIPENDPNQLRDNTFNGIYISQDSLGGHSNFLSKYADRSDIEILVAGGILFYDVEQQGYVITSYERYADETVPDPYLVFYNNQCQLVGTGKLNLLKQTGLVQNDLAGTVRHDLKTDSVYVDAVWTMEAPIDRKIWEDLAALFHDNAYQDRFDEPTFEKGLYHLLEPKDAQDYLGKLGEYIQNKEVPRYLRQTLVMSQAKLVYNPQYKTFTGKGKAVVQSMANHSVYAEMDGLFEIKERRRGGEFSIYYDNGQDWVFINFKGIVMSLLSSSDLFNMAILEKDADDRSVKAKGDEPGFVYNRGSNGRVLLLKRRLGVQEERQGRR